MELLQSLFENSQLPFLSAFLLGLMTAISPCPLATNITAIGFISKDVESQKKVFYKGLIYTAGRALTYTLLGAVLFLGADQLQISGAFQIWGEKLLGPLLIVIGIFMLGLINISFPGTSKLAEKFEGLSRNGYLGALTIGIIFALAFCPYSGVIYFGMLIPMSINSVSGLYLPLVFALATGLPVIIFAWLLAFSVKSIGTMYNRIKAFEKWFRKVVAILFVMVGLYYVYIIYF